MPASKRPTHPALAALSFVLAVGAVATASAVRAHAADLPRFSIHLSAPRVTDEVIASVSPGMHQADIEALIGEPMRIERFPHSHTVAWNYDYRDTWGYDSTFSVIFDDAGDVVGKFAMPYKG